MAIMAKKTQNKKKAKAASPWATFLSVLGVFTALLGGMLFVLILVSVLGLMGWVLGIALGVVGLVLFSHLNNVFLSMFIIGILVGIIILAIGFK